jgi:hypothetical protein
LLLSIQQPRLKAKPRLLFIVYSMFATCSRSACNFSCGLPQFIAVVDYDQFWDS